MFNYSAGLEYFLFLLFGNYVTASYLRLLVLGHIQSKIKRI